MNVEKLNKIIKKYKSNYYHNTSIYERQYDDIPNQVFNCDHIEIVYDLLKCDINKEDIDFIWNNDIQDYKNIFNLKMYIIKLELENNNVEKALIHTSLLFQLEEKKWINYYIDKKDYSNIYIRYGQTLVETKIRSYKAHQYFRKTCDMYDGMMKAMNDDYQKQLKFQKEKKNS